MLYLPKSYITPRLVDYKSQNKIFFTDHSTFMIHPYFKMLYSFSDFSYYCFLSFWRSKWHFLLLLMSAKSKSVYPYLKNVIYFFRHATFCYLYLSFWGSLLHFLVLQNNQYLNYEEKSIIQL